MQFQHVMPSVNLRDESPIPGYTVAVHDQMIKSRFQSIMDQFVANISSTVVMKVGIAKCSVKDQFSRKIGRELAASRASEMEFKIEKLVVDKDCTKMRLVNEENNLKFTLKKYRDSGKVRLMLSGRFEWFG